jgi:hypothetical protein
MSEGRKGSDMSAMGAMSDMSGPKVRGEVRRPAVRARRSDKLQLLLLTSAQAYHVFFKTNAASQNPTCIIAHGDVFKTPRQAK